MKQLVMFMSAALTATVGNLIDSGFCNSISIDAICALSAFGVIGNITYNIAQVGAYGYRVLLKDARACLCVQLFFSTVIGIFLCIK